MRYKRTVQQTFFMGVVDIERIKAKVDAEELN
jgi:hypothetical protein